MNAEQIKHELLNVTLTVVGSALGAASFIDSIEQGLRILLLVVSIVSGVLLIAINWHKGLDKIKSLWKRA